MDTPYGYPDAPRLTWQVAPVSKDEEHIELRHGSARGGGWDTWRPVAQVSRPEGERFRVEWLVDPEAEADMVREAREEIDFFMIELREPDPWAYAGYHCTTASNAYSTIHWSHFMPGPG